MNLEKMKVNDHNCQEIYHFHLFIGGNDTDSIIAQENLESLFNRYLKEKYTLTITDVLENPLAALKNSVFITPMLILKSPEPRVTIIGNFEHRDKVLIALGIIRPVA